MQAANFGFPYFEQRTGTGLGLDDYVTPVSSLGIQNGSQAAPVSLVPAWTASYSPVARDSPQNDPDPKLQPLADDLDAEGSPDFALLSRSMPRPSERRIASSRAFVPPTHRAGHAEDEQSVLSFL